MTCTVENATDDGSRILRLGMNRKMAKVIMTLADVGGQGKVQGVRSVLIRDTRMAKWYRALL